MTCRIRNVTPEDLEQVTALEAAAFPPEEAASRAAFAYRIQTFPERFFVAEEAGRIIGLVNGCASSLPAIEDPLFGPRGRAPDGKDQRGFGPGGDAGGRRRGGVVAPAASRSRSARQAAV